MNSPSPRVVIVGGGFAGLQAALCLGRSHIETVLIDKTNFHLFQPLLYQVATGYLSPSEIAEPLRTPLARQKSVSVVNAHVTKVDCVAHRVETDSESYPFDYLLLATGTTHSYFGRDDWSPFAPGLKTVDDALKIRTRILRAFELAERTDDPALRQRLLTLVIVGGGPTGVELAGAIAELAHGTLHMEYRNFDPQSTRIILFESGDEVLDTFHPKLSRYAHRTLEKLGVEIRTGTRVTDISAEEIEMSKDGEKSRMKVGSVMWAAGVRASRLGSEVATAHSLEVNKQGRILVNENLTTAAFPNLYVIGDLAVITGEKGEPVPMLAPAAIQEGKYAATDIINRLSNKPRPPFRYYDKGNMAVIGRGRAILQSGFVRITGFVAWLAWAFIHIGFLIEFGNKLVVFFRWAWNYVTNKRGSRLILSERAEVIQ